MQCLCFVSRSLKHFEWRLNCLKGATNTVWWWISTATGPDSIDWALISWLCVAGFLHRLSVNYSDSSPTQNSRECSGTPRIRVKSDFSAWNSLNVCSLNTVLFSQPFQTVLTLNGVKAHFTSHSLTKTHTVCWSHSYFFSYSHWLFLLLFVKYSKWGFEGWYICLWNHTPGSK